MADAMPLSTRQRAGSVRGKDPPWHPAITPQPGTAGVARILASSDVKLAQSERSTLRASWMAAIHQEVEGR